MKICDNELVEEMEKIIGSNEDDDSIQSSLKWLRSRQAEFDKGVEIAEQLSNFVNAMGTNDRTRGFIAALEKQHRTIQQSVFGLFLKWTYKMADYESNRYDLRNEYSVQTAKKIKRMLGKYGDNCPFI